MRTAFRAPALIAAVAALVLTAASPVAADTDGHDGPGFDLLSLDDVGGPPNQGTQARAVRQHSATRAVRYYTDRRAIREFGFHNRITSVEVVETQGDEVTVTLASDLLFAVDSADLTGAAQERVPELVADVPQGATLTVEGHTDSVASVDYNQALSERRAQAVADVVATARPDLELEVHGHGKSQLKVPETGDDVAERRAQNRRVELHYSADGAVVDTRERTERLDAVAADYVPGEPQVVLIGAEPAAVEHTVDVPGDRGRPARVRVGVEALTVRGPVARLRLQITPLDPVDGDDEPNLYELAGSGTMDLQVVDTEELITYRSAVDTGRKWETSAFRVSAPVDETFRFEAYVARPVREVDTVTVSIVPDWPSFEDVPVIWD